MAEEKKVNSFLEKLKQKAKEQQNYGGKTEILKQKWMSVIAPIAVPGVPSKMALPIAPIAVLNF